ncbi:MAG: response regulator [Candidatus Riflebacteria bacterium]|nr:response regulator [Candidatus Riflebacteria bacterium]
MENKSVLIVDDEKNICITVSQAIETNEVSVDYAVNGEEALQKMSEKLYNLVFLDLKMPGMSGIEVLFKIKETWPSVKVVIVSAHGDIKSAVGAIKIGALDFIQKPFSPEEIRSITSKYLYARPEKSEVSEKAEIPEMDYISLIKCSRKLIKDRKYSEASATIRKAIALDIGKPDGYNLLGVLFELRNDKIEAIKYYRLALEVDPTFQSARSNLSRATSWNMDGDVQLGSD